MKKFAEQLTVVYVVTWWVFGVAIVSLKCGFWLTVLASVFPPYAMVMFARFVLVSSAQA